MPRDAARALRGSCARRARLHDGRASACAWRWTAPSPPGITRSPTATKSRSCRRCRAADGTCRDSALSATRRSTSRRCARRCSTPRAGACVGFEGWVRDHNDGRAVQRPRLRGLCARSRRAKARRSSARRSQRFAIVDAACVHRIGALAIGELAVWVGVSAAHRDAAFAACRCDHRRGEAARADLEARALRRRRIRLAASGQYAGRNGGWQPRQLTPAPESVNTVAAFRPWRGFRPIVARGRRGHHRDLRVANSAMNVAEREGFEPSIRV